MTVFDGSSISTWQKQFGYSLLLPVLGWRMLPPTGLYIIIFMLFIFVPIARRKLGVKSFEDIILTAPLTPYIGPKHENVR